MIDIPYNEPIGTVRLVPSPVQGVDAKCLVGVSIQSQTRYLIYMYRDFLAHDYEELLFIPFSDRDARAFDSGEKSLLSVILDAPSLIFVRDYADRMYSTEIEQKDYFLRFPLSLLPDKCSFLKVIE
jgi:hypothetical protein